MEVFKIFSFDAAHQLPNAPPQHKCRQLHGHSYRVEIHVQGPPDPETGWVIDFGDIAKAFQPLLEQMDHHNLNQIDDLENPTSENIARWIWRQLKRELPGLSKIVVQENPTCGCVYQGQDI